MAGARLIHRSTRRLTLTPAGERYCSRPRFERGSPIETLASVSGPIPAATARRLRAFTAMQLTSPLLPDFSPAIHRCAWSWISITIRSAWIGERIDVAIRITDNPEAGAIARRPSVPFAALRRAGLTRQHGLLTTPDDLQRHNCSLYSHFASQHRQFSDAGREASVAVNGNLSAGISSLLLEAAAAGRGTMLPNWRPGRD